MATKIPPSRLDIFFWSHSHRDIQVVLKVNVGFECAVLEQGLENLAKVVSMAFGGEPEKTQEPQNYNEAVSMFNSVFANN